MVDRVVAFVGRRHHLAADEREDFASHVKVTLLDNDRAILRKFRGQSSIQTFLTVVISRLLIDYRTRAWGKWRPSAEARRGGPVGTLLERLLVRDGHSLGEACEILRANHGVSLTEAVLREMASRLPSRPRRRFESDALLEDVPSPRTADEEIRSREQQLESERVAAALTRVLQTLDAPDRLLLTLRFDDGRTVPEIAALMRAEAKPLYRRIDNLMKKLRAELAVVGVTAGAVNALTGESV